MLAAPDQELSPEQVQQYRDSAAELSLALGTDHNKWFQVCPASDLLWLTNDAPKEPEPVLHK